MAGEIEKMTGSYWSLVNIYSADNIKLSFYLQVYQRSLKHVNNFFEIDFLFFEI